MKSVGALQTMLAWAEDRALLRSTPSADPGAKTGVGGRTPPLGIPGIGRKAINPITCICISEWRSKTRDCRVHAVPAKSQAPRLSCLGACVFGVQHARPLWSSKRGPVSARQPRGQTYVRIFGAAEKRNTKISSGTSCRRRRSM